MQARSVRLPLVFSAAAAVACSGSISRDSEEAGERGMNGRPDRAGTGGSVGGRPVSGGSAGGMMPGGVAASAAVMPLRRLTRREYDNTIRDLLQDTSRPASVFPRDPAGETGFALPAAVSALDAQVAAEAAEKIAANAVKDLPRLLGCDPAKGEEGCVKGFIEQFGKRAYRRPLGVDEVGDLQKLFHEARRTLALDVATSVGAVLQAMLQSPSFLYRWEVGASKPAREGALVKLDHYQVASRLSYFLWGTMPDPELLAAADAGQLGTPEQVAAQAKRLLANRGRMAETLADFHLQWLHAEGIPDLTKDRKQNPDWNEKLAGAMLAEINGFVSALVLEGDGKLETLFSSSGFLVNAALAKVYGVSGVTGDALRPTLLNGGERAGLLTLAGVLAANAGTDSSNPVKRGQTVFRQVLCGELANPPADIPDPRPPSPNLSTRERFAEHAENACAVCHKLFDPLGFAFEHYDAIGKYRTTDGGKAVDASGTVALPSGTELRFMNGVELGRALGKSEDVQTCVARQWFRYALGRREEAADLASLAAIDREFARRGHALPDLLIGLVQAKSFLYRAPAAGEVF